MTHTKVHEFLKKRHMAVLSTVSKDNQPWGSAIYFVADEEFNFFFVTRADTFKYQNLEAKPYAALTVADEATQTTVQASGKISKVPADEMLDIALNKLEKARPKGDINWVPPIYKVHKGDYMVLRLTPDKLQYANYSKQTTDIHKDYIEDVI